MFRNFSVQNGREKYLEAFLLGFGCLIASLLPIMIADKGYFIYSGDYNAQQITFYRLVNDAVRGGQFGWSWYTDLGSDLMTSYSFYLFASPFFWITTILPKGLITLSMPFLLAAKHGLASMTAYAYIRRFVRCKRSALIGGLLYSFSGFQIFNIFFNHFQDVTAFFPLMLIAMEENINRGRKGVFAVTVAFMAMLNYYFFTGQAVFLGIYYLCRMNCPDFRTSWKKFAGLVFEAVAGTMIAAVILLPSALAITGNYRVSERLYGLNMVTYNDRTLIPRIIQTFFMPADPPANPNLFKSDYEKWASIGGYFPLFSMAGVFAFFKSHRKHWASRLSIICIICAFIPILNSAFYTFNASYYARWYYMPILIFAMMTSVSIDEEDSELFSGWKICAAALAVFGLISLLPTKNSSGKLKFFSFPADFGYFWATMIAAVCGLILCGILLARRKEGKSFRTPAVILTAAASVGCTMTMLLYAACSIPSAHNYIDGVLHGKDRIEEPVSSDNFFRIDTSEDCDNDPMVWGLPTMRTFHSVVSTSIMDFYNTIGIQRDVASRADTSHYTLRGLFSVKYYYREIGDNLTYEEIKSLPPSSSSSSKKDDKGPDDSNIPELLPGFEYIGDNGFYEIYENKLWVPMGFGYSSYISESKAENMKNSDLEAHLLDSLILSDEQAEKYSDILKPVVIPDKSPLDKKAYRQRCLELQQNCSSSFTYDSKGFSSDIELDSPQLVFFSVPYSEGWSAEVNGESVDVEKVSYGFMAVRAEAGKNTIVFRYHTPGLKEGTVISLAGIMILAIYLVICLINKNSPGDKGPRHYYCYKSGLKINAGEEYFRQIRTVSNTHHTEEFNDASRRKDNQE